MLWCWCDYVKNAHEKGQVSDDEWQQFWERHTITEFIIRPKIRRGERIPYRLSTFDQMYNLGSNSIRPWDNVLTTMAINGVTWKPDGGLRTGRDSVWRFWRGEPDGAFELPKEILDQLHDGQQAVTAEIQAQGPGCCIHKTVALAFNLQTRCDSTVTLVMPDAKIRQVMVKAISPGIRYYSQPSKRIYDDCRIDATPVSACFKVYMRIGGQEYACGKLLAKSGYPRNRGGWADVDAVPAKADIILRPDPETASRYADFDQMYGEEIVFKNVPIR